MSAQIPQSHRDLLEKPVYVVLTTLMPDGQPQSSVVWCDLDGDVIRVNTTRDRQKERNMAARPKATVIAIDPDNPFRWIEVRGDVTEITEEGGEAHISELAQQYVGVSSYYGDFAPAEQRNQETRVICKIKPTRVIAFGE